MKIQFLGTGAADWDWKKPLNAGVRGSASTLLDDRILIDAGETGLENLLRFHIDPAEITDLLITHSHTDHFNPEIIKKIAEAPGRNKKLCVYTTPEACLPLDKSVMKTVKLKYGKKIVIGKLKIEVLSANHMLRNEREAAFHFLFTTPEKKRMLYALDGGWMTSYTRNKLGFIPLDMIVWDATSGTALKDWRFADHNDLEMISFMRIALAPLGLVNEKTVHVFDHIARTLWPASAEDRTKTAEFYHGILAEDGMVLNL